MAGILRKILPLGPSVPKEELSDDDDDIECSFAMEYHGPLITSYIPKAIPVVVDQLPIAAAISSSSSLNDIPLPVIQPIVKTGLANRKLTRKPRIFCEPTFGQKSSDDDQGTSIESASSSCKVDDECASNLSQRGKSSGKLETSESRDGLQGLSGRLEIVELSNGVRQSLEFGDLALGNTDSTESGLSSPSPSSSEAFSCEGEEIKDEGTSHIRKPSVVTFGEPELIEIVQEEYDESEAGSSHEVPSNGKKESCYRCLKGNRFTRKETCLVCNARYCRNCVLRAMGSMPEGRKCLTCIGKRIKESNRKDLGRCSRMLKHLLSKPEIEQIMKCELSSEVNRLPPQLVYVNGEPLSENELLLLQSCPNPPKKLKPGSYWYDKVSGFWGKEGHGPSQIISHQLSVGVHIKPNASNGNTKIFINNREITKKEHFMLKAAGVQCEGNPHFWVSADGSYQEEGQRNIVGRIWDRPGIKLACAVLSLPVPSDSLNNPAEDANNRNSGSSVTHKILLVGCKKSGTSTIYKQAKILYKVPFTEYEHQNLKLMIQSNLYGYLGILLEGREQFEMQSLLAERKTPLPDEAGPSGTKNPIDGKTAYSISPRMKSFSDWLLEVIASGNLEIFPAAAREYAPFVEELWKDSAFQATYSRRHELEMLPTIATYFLERAVEISRSDYEPSDMDILYAEGITSSNGLSSMEFSFPRLDQENSLEPSYRHDPLQRFQLIRLHTSTLGENCKLVNMFEDVDIVLFCVSLTDYDEFSEDSNGVRTNKMLANKKLFETIITHPTFDSKDFLLILNQFDLLEEKIEHVPLTNCEWFHDFNPVIGHNHKGGPSLAQHAFHYIALKFKKLFKSLTDRKLYASLVTGMEPDSVDEALRYSREILKWEDEQQSVIHEFSSTDIEASSSS